MSRSTRRFRRLLMIAVVSLAPVPAALGVDHGNLDEGRPLRMSDPYPVAYREWVVELGLRFHRFRDGTDRWALSTEVLYGVAPDLHVGAAIEASDSSEPIEETTRPGDVVLGALYSFNQESLAVPAFGLQVNVSLLTGNGSEGVDAGVTALVRKSFSRANAYVGLREEFLSESPPGGRDTLFGAVLGLSFAPGAPDRTRTILLFDLFTEQSIATDEDDVVGIEAGLRYQWRPRVVVDVGFSHAFRGPDSRSDAVAIAGVSFGF